MVTLPLIPMEGRSMVMVAIHGAAFCPCFT